MLNLDMSHKKKKFHVPEFYKTVSSSIFWYERHLKIFKQKKISLWKIIFYIIFFKF